VKTAKQITCCLSNSGPSGAGRLATLFATVSREEKRHRPLTRSKQAMLRETESPSGVYEFHWMRHADRYLALVRAALEKDPNDLELQELLLAMEAAVAAKQKRPLH
jgi:hypothetical protein